MTNKYNKFYNSILCAMIGDLIGYGNCDIEFNDGVNMKVKTQKDVERLSGWSVRHVVNFISKGGLSNINIKKLIVSDDSILLLANLDALIETYKKDNDVIIEAIKNSMIKYYKNDKLREKRNYGIRTQKAFNRIIDGKDWKKWAYSSDAGGSGASMRTMPIGLIYHGKNNREKLIYLSIWSSMITHNNPIGYLGGLASALFTALALEGVDTNKWSYELLEIMESKYFKNIIFKINEKFPEYKKQQENDIIKFITWWQTYLEYRFKNKNFVDNTENNLISMGMRFFDSRSRFYYDNFARKGYFNPGSNGGDSVIISYDAFMDSKSFESLVYYSMLHAGDSDTTGCIAGALYGAYNDNIKLNFDYSNMDMIDQMNKLAKKAKFIFNN